MTGWLEPQMIAGRRWSDWGSFISMMMMMIIIIFMLALTTIMVVAGNGTLSNQGGVPG